MSDLSERVDTLETAVKALATVQLGDVPGHDFHGNQYTGGGGGSSKDLTDPNMKQWMQSQVGKLRVETPEPDEHPDRHYLTLVNKDLVDTTAEVDSWANQMRFLGAGGAWNDKDWFPIRDVAHAEQKMEERSGQKISSRAVEGPDGEWHEA